MMIKGFNTFKVHVPHKSKRYWRVTIFDDQTDFDAFTETRRNYAMTVSPSIEIDDKNCHGDICFTRRHFKRRHIAHESYHAVMFMQGEKPMTDKREEQMAHHLEHLIEEIIRQGEPPCAS